MHQKMIQIFEIEVNEKSFTSIAVEECFSIFKFARFSRCSHSIDIPFSIFTFGQESAFFVHYNGVTILLHFGWSA